MHDLKYVATAPTVYGIETCRRTLHRSVDLLERLQQHLPFTVCDAGCETAEEQSDDEVRTSQVPERSEGKTKVIRQQSLPFTVLKPSLITYCFIHLSCFVATAPTVYGIETYPFHGQFVLILECCNNTYRLRY